MTFPFTRPPRSRIPRTAILSTAPRPACIFLYSCCTRACCLPCRLRKSHPPRWSRQGTRLGHFHSLSHMPRATGVVGTKRSSGSCHPLQRARGPIAHLRLAVDLAALAFAAGGGPLQYGIFFYRGRYRWPAWIALRTVSSRMTNCCPTSAALLPSFSSTCAWAFTSSVSTTADRRRRGAKNPAAPFPGRAWHTASPSTTGPQRRVRSRRAARSRWQSSGWWTGGSWPGSAGRTETPASGRADLRVDRRHSGGENRKLKLWHAQSVSLLSPVSHNPRSGFILFSATHLKIPAIPG